MDKEQIEDMLEEARVGAELLLEEMMHDKYGLDIDCYISDYIEDDFKENVRGYKDALDYINRLSIITNSYLACELERQFYGVDVEIVHDYSDMTRCDATTISRREAILKYLKQMEKDTKLKKLFK